MPPSLPNSVLPPAWMQVLETMQQSLAQALAAAGEPPPESAAGPAPAGRTPPWQADLDRLDRRLGQLEASTRRAQEGAAAMDAELAAGAEALRQWLAAAAANRQSLANEAGRTV
jgi:hypothetical protein